MSILFLPIILILAFASITIKKTVPAILTFMMMMFLLGIYYISEHTNTLLGLFQIFVYTGGIVVLTLFGVSVIGSEFPKEKIRPLSIIFSLIVFILLAYLITIKIDIDVITTNSTDNSLFAKNYSDFLLIFALIGSSLLYGSVKMIAQIHSKRKR